MRDPSGREDIPMERQGTGTQFVLMFAMCMVTWFVFSGRYDVFHLVLGMISSLIVTWASGDLLSPNRKISMRCAMTISWRMAVYLIWLVIEVVKANIHVFKLALSPNVRDRIEPSIVTFKTVLKTDLAKFVLANSITLTPGTVTIKIEDGVFVVHAIDTSAAEGLQEQMERRVAHIFSEIES